MSKPTLLEVALEAEKDFLPLRQRPRQRLGTLKLILNWWSSFHTRPIDQITTGDVHAVLAHQRLEGKSAATCNRALSALSIIMESALERGLIIKNPCRKSRLRLREGAKVPRFLSADEATRFLNAAEPRYRPIFACAIYAGLRLGEVRALTWADLDLPEDVITVRSSNGGETKSGHQRVIPLHPTLKALLPHPRSGEELVFKSERTGGMISNPRKALHRALKAAEIEEMISFHDLRHTFATLMVASGVDIRTLQAFLGHSTLKMTLRYVHLIGYGHSKDAILKLPIGQIETL